MDTSSNNTNLGSLAELPVTEAVEFRDWFPEEFRISSNMKNKKFSKTGIPELSEKALRFLKAVVNNQDLASSHFPKLVGVSTSTAGKIRGLLARLGLTKEIKRATSKRGAQSIVIQPTPKAFALLQSIEKKAK